MRASGLSTLRRALEASPVTLVVELVSLAVSLPVLIPGGGSLLPLGRGAVHRALHPGGARRALPLIPPGRVG